MLTTKKQKIIEKQIEELVDDFLQDCPQDYCSETGSYNYKDYDIDCAYEEAKQIINFNKIV